MEPFLGQIQPFGFNFPPRGWAHCDGQLLAISSNTALFSLLGTTFGGDGRTTFGLPDLRGRVASHAGNGPGLSTMTWGERGGAETHTLQTNQIPVHTHAASTELTLQAKCNTGEGDSEDPVGNLAATAEEGAPYSTGSADGNLDSGAVVGTATTTVNNAGGNQSHNNMQPFLGIYHSIALVGTFPSRN
jgi:microcystin-dependent protein